MTEEKKHADASGEYTDLEQERFILPILALRGIVAFPGAPIKLELVSEEDRNTVKTAAGSGKAAALPSFRLFHDGRSSHPEQFRKKGRGPAHHGIGNLQSQIAGFIRGRSFLQGSAPPYRKRYAGFLKDLRRIQRFSSAHGNHAEHPSRNLSRTEGSNSEGKHAR